MSEHVARAHARTHTHTRRGKEEFGWLVVIQCRAGHIVPGGGSLVLLGDKGIQNENWKYRYQGKNMTFVLALTCMVKSHF